MDVINLQWRLFLTDESKYPFLDRNLFRLTKWYIAKKYDKFNNIWEDIYHDLTMKVLVKKNEILSGECKPIKNFRAWYYFVMKNHLYNIALKEKREKRKLLKYQIILESENEEHDMNGKEQEILLKFSNIMSIQKNQAHVSIFVDFVRGKSYNDITRKHGISKENARKIIERMRKVCIELWAKDLFLKVKKETDSLFGRKKYEAIVSLVMKLIADLPDEYKEIIKKLLSR